MSPYTKTVKPRHRQILGFLLLAVLLAGGASAAYWYWRPDQSLSEPVPSATPAPETEEVYFQVEVPSQWQVIRHQDQGFSYQIPTDASIVEHSNPANLPVWQINDASGSAMLRIWYAADSDSLEQVKTEIEPTVPWIVPVSGSQWVVAEKIGEAEWLDAVLVSLTATTN